MNGFWNTLWQEILKALKSKVFWMAVAAIVYALFGERAGIGSDALLAAILVIISYIFGTAVESAAKRL